VHYLLDILTTILQQGVLMEPIVHLDPVGRRMIDIAETGTVIGLRVLLLILIISTFHQGGTITDPCTTIPGMDCP
jgi:hypothetical protein